MESGTISLQHDKTGFVYICMVNTDYVHLFSKTWFCVYLYSYNWFCVHLNCKNCFCVHLWCQNWFYIHVYCQNWFMFIWTVKTCVHLYWKKTGFVYICICIFITIFVCYNWLCVFVLLKLVSCTFCTVKTGYTVLTVHSSMFSARQYYCTYYKMVLFDLLTAELYSRLE